MPVIQVFAPQLDDVHAALEVMCHEVAQALRLQPSDVIATHIPVAACVMPGFPEATWPVVILHGSPRPADQMALAHRRVTALIESWPGGTGSGSWVSWQLPA